MRRIRKHSSVYGLKARFAAILLLAALVSGGVFCLLYYTKDYLILSYLYSDKTEQRIMREAANDLQDYIDKKHLSSDQLPAIQEWVKGQPPLLLELYSGDTIVYSSYYSDNTNDGYVSDGTGLLDPSDAYPVRFSDKSLSAVIYIDYSYKFYVLGNATAFASAVIVFIIIFISSNKSLTDYIIQLKEDIQIIEGGHLDHKVRVEGNDELTDLARSMNRMRESFRDQLITEQKLRQTSSKLISEMSHDLRTPLTGLLLYTEIIKSGKYENEADFSNYIDKIDAKAHLIKQLSDNIFEYAIEGKSDYGKKTADFAAAMCEIVNDIRSEAEPSGFSLNTELGRESAEILIIPNLTKRISANIVSNIIKYADRSSPVCISTVYDGNYCGLSIINTVAKEIEHSDSHGIGIASMKSMMKHMDGVCTADQTEDAFELLLLFRRKQDQP